VTFKAVVEQVEDAVIKRLRVRDRVGARKRARGAQREADLNGREVEPMEARESAPEWQCRRATPS
jgi:hypothetical protein